MSVEDREVGPPTGEACWNCFAGWIEDDDGDAHPVERFFTGGASDLVIRCHNVDSDQYLNRVQPADVCDWFEDDRESGPHDAGGQV